MQRLLRRLPSCRPRVVSALRSLRRADRRPYRSCPTRVADPALRGVVRESRREAGGYHPSRRPLVPSDRRRLGLCCPETGRRFASRLPAGYLAVDRFESLAAVLIGLIVPAGPPDLAAAGLAADSAAGPVAVPSTDSVPVADRSCPMLFHPAAGAMNQGYQPVDACDRGSPPKSNCLHHARSVPLLAAVPKDC